MEKSKELLAFEKHFKNNCSVKVIKTIESRDWYHWKRLAFDGLRYDDLVAIANYIYETFHGKGQHWMPKIQTYNGYTVLTVDVELIKTHIL